MDTTPPSSEHDRDTPDQWGDVARLPACVVARDHPHRWADSGLPDSLADLDTPVETVWAAVRLALSGADYTTLAHTLRVSEDIARQIIIATTEALIAADGDGDGGLPRTGTGVGLQGNGRR